MARSHRSAITSEDRDFVETWEHISPQQWGIIHLDARGEYRAEVIRGRREFMLTTEERILSQDRIRDKANDPFQNGAFRPIVVPDSITVESNPNALSDEEIQKILSASDVAFQENVKLIDSRATLRRMLELAEDSEVTVKRYRQLESRLSDVRGGRVKIESSDPRLQKYLDDARGVPAEPSESPERKPQRRMGGMSSDYRNTDDVPQLP